jgi:hypothetical protein
MIMNKEQIKYYLKTVSLLLLLVLAFNISQAHVVVNELEKMSRTETAWLYLKLGYEHILPLGFDHILFILSLFLISPKLKPLLWQATTFTVAHTVTLGLTMYNVIRPSSAIVEPVIALSIVFVAIENILFAKMRASRFAIVFLFGLVHGMGFASALGQLGLPQNAYLSSLIMFNIGVELGQVTIIMAAFFIVGKWFGDKAYYRRLIVVPTSALIMAIASFWTIERLFF